MTKLLNLVWVRRAVALAALVLLWEATGWAGLINPLYAAPPSQVAALAFGLFADGSIWPHLQATFSAALLGLAIGLAIGIVLGFAAALLAPLAALLEPVMLLLNAVPRVILAPLFVIWMGIDLGSKVALATVLVAVLILGTAWRLMREAAHVLLEGVPASLDRDGIAGDLVKNVAGVREVHHMHLWTIDGDRNMATLHACLDEGVDAHRAVAAIKARLAAVHGIGHATVEPEYDHCADGDHDGHAHGHDQGHDHGHDHDEPAERRHYH